jgi:hypothetical protein
MVQRRYRNFAPRGQRGSLWWLHVLCPQCIWDRSIRRLEAVAVFEVNWEDARHHFSGPRGECWPIDLFCVDPDLQGKGFTYRDCWTWLTRDPPVATGHIYEVGSTLISSSGLKRLEGPMLGQMSQVRGGSIMFYARHLQDQVMG